MTAELEFPDEELQQRMRAYIHRTWDTLSRDLGHPASATADIKVEAEDDQPALIYVSAKEDISRIQTELQQRWGRKRNVEIRVLPPDVSTITEHGLLYLPGPYVVPGGRFNEFYGWDSYFIQRGLLRGGRVDLARSMVEQALYQVQHYGTVLNANRTYYLTRSHPPLLSRMVRDQYEQDGDREWLRAALPLIEQFYFYWRVPPHLNQATGLSRYYDLGAGPAPEVEFSERDEAGRSHYDRMREYLRSAPIKAYDPDLFYDREKDCLTELAYVGDRSMRESGFDPTDRFGPLNLDVIHFAPVCLNVLLHETEADLAALHEATGNTDAAALWAKRNGETASLVQRYFWNESAGLYFDYHLGTESQRSYPFLTTFWPLWAGIASAEQAERVRSNIGLFLQPGGLQASARVTGEQWDAPFAWAPLQWMAVKGLYRYGFDAEARMVARRFTAMVAASFDRRGVMLEKYDAVECSGSVEGKIQFGYLTNEVGFGWTNAVILEFLDEFEASDQAGSRHSPKSQDG